jgi:sugar lactone lactonase YvrE
MKAKWLISLFAFALGSGWSLAWTVDPPQFPQPATFSTLVRTEFQTEGLTGDAVGNLFTAGRQVTNGAACPVYRVNLASGAASLATVGLIPDPAAPAPAAALCNPAGIAFNEAGDLFVADSGVTAGVATGIVYFFPANTLSATSPSTATVFARGVPGANGIAFDRDGNLLVSDGTTGQGRVWRIEPSGGVCEPNFDACEELFRIQPMANALNVGRQNSTLQPSQTPPAPASPQPLVANGLAFTRSGDLLIADTARGAIWNAQFDRHGNLKSQTGCDTTFTDNTLCLSNVFVANPVLEGADGIALDRAGNTWVDANERNAVAVVTKDGRVFEIFRNPVNTAGLRNSAEVPPAGVGNNHILEFPTSPFLSGKTFCSSSADGNRRDNSPAADGEITPGGPLRGKISCMDQELKIQGLPLPID